MECIIDHIREELDSQLWEIVVLKNKEAVDRLLDYEPVHFRLEDDTEIFIQLVDGMLFAEYYVGRYTRFSHIAYYKSYNNAKTDQELIDEILKDALNIEEDMLEGEPFKEFIHD